MPIRNVIFDVGNVLVPWDPAGIETRAFGAERLAQTDYISPFRGNETWLAINRGELSLDEAKPRYVGEHGLTDEDVDRLYEALFASFPLITNTRALMDDLSAQGYRLFAITDNVHEIVAHLKREHDFWDMFEVAAVSAELGVMKPDPRIYQWLLDTADIRAEESVFLDDVQRNVDGAKAVGMEAVIFTDAGRAREDLSSLGVALSENDT